MFPVNTILRSLYTLFYVPLPCRHYFMFPLDTVRLFYVPCRRYSMFPVDAILCSLWTIFYVPCKQYSMFSVDTVKRSLWTLFYGTERNFPGTFDQNAQFIANITTELTSHHGNIGYRDQANHILKYTSQDIFKFYQYNPFSVSNISVYIHNSYSFISIPFLFSTQLFPFYSAPCRRM